MDRPAVDLGDVADDGEAEAGPRLARGVEPRAAGEELAALLGGNAGVPPRLLGLRFAVGEKLIDLFGERPDFGREILADAGLFARTDRGDVAPHPPQRPEAVEGLQRGEPKQAGAKRGEAPDQR